jgi:hypothetical protein
MFERGDIVEYEGQEMVVCSVHADGEHGDRVELQRISSGPYIVMAKDVILAPGHRRVASLVNESHGTAIEKGWWPPEGRNMGETLMLAVTELAEAMEETRKEMTPEAMMRFQEGKPEGFMVELADCWIRMADLIGSLNPQLFLHALDCKLAYNKTRPYRHGGKTA